MEFQALKPSTPKPSYVFHTEDPTTADLELMTPNHLVSCQYNPKEASLIAGGCYNGQVLYWDERRGGKPVAEISLSHSHSEPVFKTIWTSSKTGSEFFTASSDGLVKYFLKIFPLLVNSCCQVLWWDIRKFVKSVDKLILDPYQEDNVSLEGATESAQGASTLEYEWTIPSKFMVGTQQGRYFPLVIHECIHC